MDLSGFGDFLQTRRHALQPEDVGLRRGPRRRVAGLRREELAELCGMSVDYLARLERGGGPAPSEQMAAAIARGLRLSQDERDYLFELAGFRPPARSLVGGHVSPGLMRIVDRLGDSVALVLDGLGRTLFQSPTAAALFGDHESYGGLSRYMVYRWFEGLGERALYRPSDRDRQSEILVAQLRSAVGRYGPKSVAAELADTLNGQSAEFAAFWGEHHVGLAYEEEKRFIHPEVGEIELHCQTLVDPVQWHTLLVFTATPGTDSSEKLALLGVVGTMTTGQLPT